MPTGVVITENAILVEENQGLPDFETMQEFMDIHLVDIYQFRGGIMRKTESAEYAEMF